jgi:hypothetical protein
MSHWSKGVPVVTVPRGRMPKRVTFVYPYYENPEFLRRQIDGWRAFPASLRQFLSAIVVDDGSPTSPAVLPPDLPFPIRLFRIEQDVRWNWIAARNIGLYQAPDGWCVMTDMDHVVPFQTAEALVYGQHDPGCAYAFSRQEHTGQTAPAHSASWFLTTQLFWKVGGYDETFSGLYGSDGIYRRRLMAAAPTRILSDVLIRHEYVGDSSTVRYQRKTVEDDRKIRALMAQMKPGHETLTLSFPYHEVRA